MDVIVRKTVKDWLCRLHQGSGCYEYPNEKPNIWKQIYPCQKMLIIILQKWRRPY